MFIVTDLVSLKGFIRIVNTHYERENEIWYINEGSNENVQTTTESRLNIESLHINFAFSSNCP